LSWKELACRDGTPYPADWHGRALILAGMFEAIRRACGNKPIVIDSAYRTPAYNVQIGGEPDSQHLQGRALDLKPPDGLTVVGFHTIILALAWQQLSVVGGVGIYNTFCHVDIRPRVNGYLAQWDLRTEHA
jgi:uncharacterized protein YcbK (DUF882 family)